MAGTVLLSARPFRVGDRVRFQASFLARLRAGVRPSDVQRLIERTVSVPTRGNPHIDLVEMDDDEVVVRVSAVPLDGEDGWKLADEILSAVDQVTRGEVTMEHAPARPRPTPTEG